jgi:hypothetical protein
VTLGDAVNADADADDGGAVDTVAIAHATD